MINTDSLLFGTDAELFLRTSAGNPIPRCGMVGGTKEAPKPLTSLGDGFAIQEDGAAAEFNIPPTHKIPVFALSVAKTLEMVEMMLPKAIELDYAHASLVFDESYLKIPQMNRMGCEADFNAWTMRKNDRPHAKVPGFRSAAAHMHIGWDTPEDDDKLQVIRFADIFCVLPTIAHQTKEEEARRTLYGQAGAFRFKPYGVEHRVLANQWIESAKKIDETLRSYLLAILALNYKVEIDEVDFPRIIDAINKPHPKLAVMLHEKYIRRLQKALGPEFSLPQFHGNFY